MANQNRSSTFLHLYFSITLLIGLPLTGCYEEQRVITPFVPSGNRVVLIEEFTGKGCTNCPRGSRELENLLSQFPNNLVAVSLHAGFFANPQFFPLGTYDLRTDEGEFLLEYLSQPLGYPSAVINRKAFGGEMQLSLNQWASAIASEIQVAPAIDLSIVRTYNVETKQLSVTVSGIGKEPVAGDIRLSVMLTESGIIDAQDDFEAGGIVQDYNHKHVLRDMLTPQAGAPVLTNITTGQTFSASYTHVLGDNWDPDKMEIIAFVSVVNGSDFPVIQATTLHVGE